MPAIEKPFCRRSYQLAPALILDTPTGADAGVISSMVVSMDPWRALGYSEPSIQAYILRGDPALHRFAVRIDGALAGVVFLRYPWLFGPYIEFIAIFPSRQKHGTGRAIVQWMESELRGISKNIWALVSSFNIEARRFYGRMGFREVAPIADLVRTGCEEILIRKPLRAP